LTISITAMVCTVEYGILWYWYHGVW